MRLQLLNPSPTGLKLKNQRVVCYTKPFTYSGRKVNAFFTLIGTAVKRGAAIKEMSLLTPIRYRFVIRRKHSRKRAREGAIRVKAWDGRKRKNFWISRPDLQTVNDPSRYRPQDALVRGEHLGGRHAHVDSQPQRARFRRSRGEANWSCGSAYGVRRRRSFPISM